MTALTLPLRTPLAVAPYYTIMPSPIGELTLVSDGVSLTALYIGAEHRWASRVGQDWRLDPGPFGEVEQQLEEYFDGRRRTFELPVAPRGTPFQLAVWTILATVPYGMITTYGAIAAELGKPTASRAVGMANGRNPVSIILPCHRVIGANGLLIGYGGGMDRKQQLLKLERSACLPA
ncbi:MAG: methylated-DNA--[protein]-cysteine S-methyltransferase [Actinomycetota bacterium]|nr:methylated-DNA--[protein]-cysteine S-methyltransferase [Actinomycetota bacterium]